MTTSAEDEQPETRCTEHLENRDRDSPSWEKNKVERCWLTAGENVTTWVNVRQRETSDGRFRVIKLNLTRSEEIWSVRWQIDSWRVTRSRYVLKLLIGTVRRSKSTRSARLRPNNWRTTSWQASATTTVKWKNQRQEEKCLPWGGSNLLAL